MSLCLAGTKDKNNMQINYFYWGSVEKQCLVSLYKDSFEVRKQLTTFFDKASRLLAYSDSVEIYTSAICIEVSSSEMCCLYKIFAPEWQDWTNSEDMAQCCHSVFPKKPTRRHALYHFSQARPWKTNKQKKHEVNVIAENYFITFASMYNCFTSSGYQFFLWKSIGYQFHNFLKDVVFIMVCYNSAPLYLKVILELEMGWNIASKVVPFCLKLHIL